jgi:hypothetical protein
MARADLLRLSLSSIRRPCWSASHGNRSPTRCSWPISYFGCCAGTRAQPAAQRDLLISHPRTPTRTGFCDGGDEFRVPASIPSRAALAVFVGDLIAGKDRTKETCPQASSFGSNRSERGSATANDQGALTRKMRIGAAPARHFARSSMSSEWHVSRGVADSGQNTMSERA